MGVLRRLGFVCIMSLILFGLYQAFNNDIFRVTAIDIYVSETSPTLAGTPGERERLLTRLRKLTSAFSGRQIWEVDLNNLKSTVISDGWVDEAQISRILPNLVEIKIQPQPIVALMAKQNVYFPVTSRGAVLKPLEKGNKPELPVVRGEIFRSSPEKLKGAIELISALPADGLFNPRNIFEIGYVKDSGYIVNLISPSVEVLLGENEFDTKIARAIHVANYLSANQLRGRVIDATYAKKVLVRLRKGS